MKFITAREIRQLNSKVWSEDQREPVVYAPNGKPEALIYPVDEDNFDLILRATRKAVAIASVQAMQEQSLKQGTDQLTNQEIEAEIQAVRRDRESS
ncbi:MAG: type II toxin-antitoxin system Phd/YefM family antitoxin [Cyanophyceae cyanobacterium]